MPHDPKNNPYSQATGVYGKQKQQTPDQRELESHLLIKAAGELRTLYDRWDEATEEDVNNILTYNRKLWTVFFDSAIENPDDRPKALRENIISLCNFIFKRTLKVMAERDKELLLTMIDINREIAAGLNQKPQTESSAETTSSSDKKTDDTSEGTSEDDGNPSSGGFTPTSI